METIAQATAPNSASESDSKPTIRAVPIVLEPTTSLIQLNLADLWAYRELLYFLIWRDLKVRYKQTMLGVAWVIMQPLVLAGVFTIFLGKFARIPSAGVPYLLLVFSGLIPWMFFSSAVVTAGNSVVGSAHLITKVYFPRLIVPLSAICGRLVDFAISCLVLAGLMYYYRVELSWKLATAPIFVLLLTALAFGVGTLTAAWNVKYRDVGIMLPVIVQVWMFVTPIVYPLDIVPARWRTVYALNPLVGLIEGFRAVLLNGALNFNALLISVGITAALVVCALFNFRRMEKEFADVV
jgi:lipopolysaccharide transport system permease protein